MSMMNMNRYLVNAFQLNNDGVSLLLEGKDKTACARFRESLSLLQKVLEENENMNKEDIVSTESRTIIGPSTSEKDCETKESLIYGKTVLVPGLQNGFFFFYNYAITFDGFVDLSSQQPIQNEIRIFIACVILNIALIYHRQALLGRTQLKSKVKTLYERVSKILTGEEFSPFYEELAFVAILGATNNIALMHHEEGQHQVSSQGFRQLAFLLATKHNSNAFSFHGIISTYILAGINLNIIVASLRTSVACAA